MQSQVVLSKSTRGQRKVVSLIVGMLLGVATLSAQADTPTAVANTDISALMHQARNAMAAGHVLAPAGANAFELYLRAGEVKPTDARPREALRDLYPMATAAADGAIKRGDYAEARRLLELIDRAMPGTYTVNSLRSRVEHGEPALTQR